ncbi:hypothetical protein ACEN2I_06305 [Flavobacterium sp. W22_SRS_FK3]|uniref:hypothetical protein n=1 Tax=Flavobacterium sp. W22_SRS_FK3 TaxID=3240275 RepID=UPI003F91BF48
MEPSNIFTTEELAKCPYHAQLNQTENNHDERKDVNTGDWDAERNEAGTDPNRNENVDIDNSGGA